MVDNKTVVDNDEDGSEDDFRPDMIEGMQDFLRQRASENTTSTLTQNNETSTTTKDEDNASREKSGGLFGWFKGLFG